MSGSSVWIDVHFLGYTGPTLRLDCLAQQREPQFQGRRLDGMGKFAKLVGEKVKFLNERWKV